MLTLAECSHLRTKKGRLKEIRKTDIERASFIVVDNRVLHAGNNVLQILRASNKL